MGVGVNSSLLSVDSIVPEKTTHPKEISPTCIESFQKGDKTASSIIRAEI